MSAAAVVLAAIAAVLMLGIGAAGAVAALGLRRDGRCGCGHVYSAVDTYTGRCNATVIEKNWLSGVRMIRKRVPCKCTQHAPAGAAETTRAAM